LNWARASGICAETTGYRPSFRSVVDVLIYKGLSFTPCLVNNNVFVSRIPGLTFLFRRIGFFLLATAIGGLLYIYKTLKSAKSYKKNARPVKKICD